MVSFFRMGEQPPRKPRKLDEFSPDVNPSFSVVPAEVEQPSSGQQAARLLWEVGRTVAIIVIVAFFIIRPFIVQPFVVNGESMEPNFQNGDYLLINQFNYHFVSPKRGESIVFKAPPEPETNYIKRVIGVPGDTVELKNGKLYVSNAKHPQAVEVKEPYLAQNGVVPPTLPESEETRWEVGEKQYFVVGDNRLPEKSSDSRDWGLVPRNLIIGKVGLRVYPPASFGGLKHFKHPELSFSTAQTS